MPGDEVGPGSVVHRHRHEPRLGGAVVGGHRHDRQVVGDDAGRGEPLPLRGDQHDRLHRLVLEVLDGGVERGRRRVGDAGEADEVARLSCCDLDGDHRARRPVQVGPRREHPDHAGASRDERAGRGVAAVAELGDRPLDALLRRRPDVGVAVEDTRHRLVRHARRPGDVVHPGRPRHATPCGHAWRSHACHVRAARSRRRRGLTRPL